MSLVCRIAALLAIAVVLGVALGNTDGIALLATVPVLLAAAQAGPLAGAATALVALALLAAGGRGRGLDSITVLEAAGVYAGIVAFGALSVRGRGTARAARQIVDMAPDGIVSVDTDGRIRLANRRAEALFRYGSGELIGLSIESLVPERLQEPHRSHRHGFARAPHARPMGRETNIVGRRKDGSELPLDIALGPLGAAGGNGVVAVIRDDTQRREADAALRRAEQRFRTSVETMLDRFAILAAVRGADDEIADFRIEYVNEAARRAAGGPQPVGRPVLEVFPAFETGGLLDSFRGVVRSKRSFDGEVVAHGQGDRFGVALDVRAVPHGDGVAVAWRDITPRKRMEKELHDAHALLEEAYRRLGDKAAQLQRVNADLSDFAHHVSHDLVDPLAAIRLLADSLELRLGAPLPPEGDELLRAIRSAIDGMDALVHDLLHYAKLGHADHAWRLVESGAALEDATVALRARIESTGARIRSGTLPVLTADRGHLARLFQNLLSNAIRFSRPEEPPRVEVDASREAEGWRFEVRDNGIGVRSEHREVIFGAFQRQTSTAAGWGLGLAICKRIVELRGGRLWVDTSPLGGATFCFTVPDRVPEPAGGHEDGSLGTGS